MIQATGSGYGFLPVARREVDCRVSANDMVEDVASAEEVSVWEIGLFHWAVIFGLLRLLWLLEVPGTRREQANDQTYDFVRQEE